MKGSNVKGVTPVISAVLLMTIAVAAGATAWQFQTGLMEQFKKSGTSDLQERELRQKSDINMEYMYNSSNNYTFTSLANTGSIAIDIEADNQKKLRFFVDGKPISDGDGTADSTSWKYVNQNDPEDYTLGAGQAVLINTTETFPAMGQSKSFKVTGPYETSDTKVCVSTGSDSC